MFTHDVDYNVESVDSIDKLNLELDALRIGGLVNLEALHQLLTKNKPLADANGWDTATLLSKLETMIETLRKDI